MGSPDGAGLNEIQEAAREQFARQSHRYAKGHILEDVSDVVRALQHVELPARAKFWTLATGAGNTGLYLAELGYEVTLGGYRAPDARPGAGGCG